LDRLDRFVALEGCFNFRDLGGRATRGGRRVRTGRLFRSDALHHMTPGDVARVRDALGVRTVVDLRSAVERDAEAPAALCAPPVTVHHVPLFDRERPGQAGGMGGSGAAGLSLGQLYALMLQFAREQIVRTVGILSASAAPAVFHCAAGKDRTGVVSAVLLGALDVPDEVIVEDYADTRRSLDRIVARLRESDSYDYVFTELPPETLHAEPVTMQELLAHVRSRYGSMQGYLQEAGVDAAAIERLAERLLE